MRGELETWKAGERYRKTQDSCRPRQKVEGGVVWKKKKSPNGKHIMTSRITSESSKNDAKKNWDARGRTSAVGYVRGDGAAKWCKEKNYANYQKKRELTAKKVCKKGTRGVRPLSHRYLPQQRLRGRLDMHLGTRTELGKGAEKKKKYGEYEGVEPLAQQNPIGLLSGPRRPLQEGGIAEGASLMAKKN